MPTPRLSTDPPTCARVMVAGRVETGDQRGRLLGFPTANIPISPGLIVLPDGVYAGFVMRSTGAMHGAAISVGRRPTFYEHRGLHLMEAHLLDFDDDLYGETITIEIVARLREQMKFESLEHLKEQLANDVAAARSELGLRS